MISLRPLSMTVAAAVVACACAEERGPPEAPLCLTWRETVAAELAERCVSCHGESDPAGDYSTASYPGVLGTGTDEVPNASAGDASSLLVRMLDPDTADATHAPFADLHAGVRRWVVECGLDYGGRVHPGGILDPTSSDFHGAMLAREGWPFDRCGSCHGDGFEGEAGQACTTCHAEGPTACVTCHSGPIASVGSHAAHGARSIDDQDVCGVCHALPDRWDAVGHVLAAPGTPDGAPAEVRFSGLALAGGAMPSWSGDTGTCNGVYCHGGASPAWFRPGEDQAACGTCHGVPPADHADDRCHVCHGEVVDDALAFVAPELHVDGIVQVGDGCTGCHGSGADPAPPRDTEGRTARTEVTVGAHQAHLRATRRLTAPLECSECHAVPSVVGDPGHIDTPGPAEVFDAAATGSLARAGGAAPAWDRASATCAGVYCHGGGPAFAGDASPDRVPAPRWTDTSGAGATCGDCHGVPPLDGTHDPALTLRDCNTCHASVDAFGNILVTGAPGAERSDHIDGEIDVR